MRQPLQRSSTAAWLLLLIVTSCSVGASAEEYFANLEAATGALDAELDEVEEGFNTALLDIDFQTAGAEGELVELFRTSITSTADSFATLVARLRELEPPSELTAPHDEAVRAGERVLTEYRTRASELAGVATLADVDAYAAGFTESGTRMRFAESCRELQAIADLENIAADLRCS